MTRPLASPTNGANSSSIAQAPPPEAVNVESDFVVILAALLCALICVVGLIAVARCAWLRRATGLSSGSPSRARPSAKANKGLKKKVLQSLPKFVYGSEGAECGVAGAKFGAGECAICLSEFVEGEELRVLPQCGHGFHVVCIDTWLGSHSSCPSCRQILVAARCQKCGQLPGAVGGAEEEQKPRQECEVGNSGGGSSSSSSFLP